MANVPPDASRTSKGKRCAPLANCVRMSDFSGTVVAWRHPERVRAALVLGTQKSFLQVRALLIRITGEADVRPIALTHTIRHTQRRLQQRAVSWRLLCEQVRRTMVSSSQQTRSKFRHLAPGLIHRPHLHSGDLDCKACPIGQAKATDEDFCTNCTIGTVAPTTGMAKCVACQVGAILESVLSFCLECYTYHEP